MNINWIIIFFLFLGIPAKAIELKGFEPYVSASTNSLDISNYDGDTEFKSVDRSGFAIGSNYNWNITEKINLATGLGLDFFNYETTHNLNGALLSNFESKNTFLTLPLKLRFKPSIKYNIYLIAQIDLTFKLQEDVSIKSCAGLCEVNESLKIFYPQVCTWDYIYMEKCYVFLFNGRRHRER